MTEQLEYKNDDPDESAELKQKADQMIIDRDKIESDLIFTYPKKGMKKQEK